MEVVLDGARAEEEPRTDLGIRQSVACQARDFGFLRGELVTRLGVATTSSLTGCEKLAPDTLGKGLGAHCREHFLSRAKRSARLRSAPLAAQPFAVNKMRPGEVRLDSRASQPLDRLEVEGLRVVAVTE